MTAADLASTAADAIRKLNHAIFPGRGDDSFTYPGDAYALIGGLDQLTGSLPQALDQLWAFLSGLAGDDRLSSDRGTPVQDLTEAGAALLDASGAAHALREALSRAHAATSHLAYIEDGPDEDEDEPCGEGMCHCYCPDNAHACGCDRPRDEDGQRLHY